MSGPARARDRWTGDVVLAQLRAADLVMVTKSDVAGETATAAFEKWLATAAPGAVIARAAADPDPAVLLRSGPGRRRRPRCPGRTPTRAS